MTPQQNTTRAAETGADLLLLSGFASIFAGIWRLWGADWAMLAGGVLAVVLATGMQRLADRPAAPAGEADE